MIDATDAMNDLFGAFQKAMDELTETWNEFVDIFKDAYYFYKESLTPKQYGMARMKIKTPLYNPYNYIRIHPKNLPYQRRCF